MPDLSAEKTAYLFAEQAASKLDVVDLHHLLDFLNREPQSLMWEQKGKRNRKTFVGPSGKGSRHILLRWRIDLA